MRIVGIGVCGPNEKYLDKTLNEFKRLCDDVLIVTNDADEETKKKIDAHGFKQYEDNREWGIAQPLVKTSLLERAGRELSPDWILALDSDEVFAPTFTRKEAERLIKEYPEEIAWHFLVVNLYNDEQHFAHSTGIQRFWNIRFYKYLPEYGLQFQRKNLHCGLAPPIAYAYGWYAPYYLLHYGLMEKADRLRKYERYKTYDPYKKFKEGNYYDELIADLPMREFDGKELLAKLKGSVDCKPRKMPKIRNKSVIPEEVEVIKDGRRVSVPKKDLQATLKQGFELV